MIPGFSFKVICRYECYRSLTDKNRIMLEQIDVFFSLLSLLCNLIMFSIMPILKCKSSIHSTRLYFALSSLASPSPHESHSNSASAET